MWILFKFMYPKPPKAFFPKEGDITTPRICNFCGHELAQYRGIVEKKNVEIENVEKKNQQVSMYSPDEQSQTDFIDSKSALANPTATLTASESIQNEWFFCNAEHQARFHAGEEYQS
ncbi:hypothetical protein [Psychrobacter sp. I-STPA10]|uniref:hypothetical protein n=1 Tax=Psychrobacter sp. I-STPA10 TaxID=2585769 RepID=UPI001E3240BC|nr:hypothetical protein [Psychrobacter sp. I-STPA10]